MNVPPPPQPPSTADKIPPASGTLKPIMMGTPATDKKAADDGYKTVFFGQQPKINEALSSSTSMISSNTGYGDDHYDIVFVFPVAKKSSSIQDPKESTLKGFDAKGEEVLKAIHATGAETYSYYDVGNENIFVLVRYSENLLCNYADIQDFPMLLDANALRAKLERGDAEKGIAPIIIPETSELTKIKPWDFIYAKWEYEYPALYYKPDDAAHPFVSHIRVMVSYMILEGSKLNGGAAIEIRNLHNKGILVDCFPMPNKEMVEKLNTTWLRCCFLPHQQPWELIKNYYGEKMSLYFAFTGHLTTWLFFPAIVGLAFQCVVVSNFNIPTAYSNPVIPFFCFLIAVWSIMTTEYWKRKESHIGMENGMIGFESKAQHRPQFYGEEIASPVNGKPMIYFPKQKAKCWRFLSELVVSVILLLAVGIVAGIYAFRWWLYTQIAADAQVVASVINVIQIQLMTLFFNFVAFAMTDLENQRTDDAYEDSMIIKLFCFQFVNNYSSFYYLAFIAPYRPIPNGASPTSAGECGYNDCMTALAVNLGITFGLRLTLTNLILWFYPFLMRWLRRRANAENAAKSNKIDQPLSDAEQEFIKEPFDTINSFLLWYSDTATFFGYTVLFTAALPVAPAFMLVHKYYSIRFDAWQILHDYRRPIRTSAEDIGNWQQIFELISVIGVITNAGLIVFTMSVLNWMTVSGRGWIFVGFQYFIFFIQLIVRVAIRDVPVYVTIQQERQAFFNSKIIDRVADEENVMPSLPPVDSRRSSVINLAPPGYAPLP